MEINEENLLKSGYKNFDISNQTYEMIDILYDNCDKFYQKKIDDKRIINCYYYDEIGGSYEFKAFKQKEKFVKLIHIYCMDKDLTIEDVEKELLNEEIN